MSAPSVVVFCRRFYGTLYEQVLLLERTPGDTAFTGWCLPGGKIHPDEPPKEAAFRELQEETGLEVLTYDLTEQSTPLIHRVANYLTWQAHSKSGTHYEILMMEATLKDPFAPIQLSKEHRQARWVLWDEVWKLPLAGNATRAILGWMQDGLELYWPLLGCEPMYPDEVGLFGVQRRYEHHSGIDLYCDLGTRVIAIEEGEVVAIEHFTGPDSTPPSPWWNSTQSVLIQGPRATLAYGEITVSPTLSVGQTVKAGDIIGIVDKPVLKNFKGRPTVMLHLELLDKDCKNSIVWPLGQPQPEGLHDPAPLLDKVLRSKPPTFNLSTYDGKRFCDPMAPRKESQWWAVWGGQP